jgi:predicted phage-related endonuclease
LDRVQKEHEEEFTDVDSIISRYQILIKEDKKLNDNGKGLEAQLKNMKDANTKYIKEKSTEIMKLNNDTTKLNSDYEDIMEQ